MDRLISFRRWMCPSTGPLLQGCSSAARKAASSRQRCFVNPASGPEMAAWRHNGQAAASRSRTMRQNSLAAEEAAAISADCRYSSSRYGRASPGSFNRSHAICRGVVRGGTSGDDGCPQGDPCEPSCLRSQSRSVRGRPVKPCACNSRQSWLANAFAPHFDAEQMDPRANGCSPRPGRRAHTSATTLSAKG